MSLTVYHADWDQLSEEWRRSGKSMRTHQRGEPWPFLTPVHEEYLGGDSVIENFDAAEALNQVISSLPPRALATFEEFCRPLLFGDGCKVIRDLFPDDHEEIIATFAPGTVRRLAQAFAGLEFPALSKTCESRQFASETIPDGEALQDYLQRWGQLIRAAADQGKGVVICGD